MSPLSLLLIGIVVLAVLYILFWPETGLLWKRKKRRGRIMRVLMEDALKHIFDCEYKNMQCGVISIAGALHVSVDEATEVVEELSAINLIEFDNDLVKLNDDGRTYALRIIRNHRLWERFLADQTGIDESEWHLHAEEAEHFLSEEEAEKLASQIGNPVIDPHGDPIPSQKGKFKRRKGIKLSNLDVGKFARVIHIEDEPHTVYSQIAASGIHLGMQIRVIESTKEKIKVFAQGDEVVLAPIIAANVSVIALEKPEEKEEYRTLSSLKRGEKAQVIGISKACRGQQRRRLMDMGIVNGSKIEYRMESAGKDPVAYEVRGAVVALRKAQSDQIFITEMEK